MRLDRFTKEQIIGVLREHETGVKSVELCRKPGISDATFVTGRLDGEVIRKPQVRHCGRLRCVIVATRIIEIVGTELRRRFSDDDKVRIVSDAIMPCASVLDVTWRHPLCTVLLPTHAAERRGVERCIVIAGVSQAIVSTRDEQTY